MRAAILIGAALAAPAAPAAAQEGGPAPRIVVTGTATVSTPPDAATIEYQVVGEGATSDAAVAAMVARRARIAAALVALDARLQPRTGEVAVTAVRGPDCQPRYDQPRLSTGPCAIVGYVATLGLVIRTGAVAAAGTAVGLIGRLDGTGPRLTGFLLADPAAAQRRAIAAALADARARAEAIAAGSGVRLGRLLAVTSGYGAAPEEDVVVTGMRRVQAPPAPPPPPVPVDLTPRPVETRAQVTVTYAIAP